MISGEEAAQIALKSEGYTNEEITENNLQDNEAFKLCHVQEGDSDWRPNGWCPYGDQPPEKYYPDCWIVYVLPVYRHRTMKYRLSLDGPEKWYWIDKHAGGIVYQGGCGGG